MKKRIISLLCIALVFSILAVNVHAAVPEEAVQPRYTYIASATAECVLNGSTLDYSASVTANYTITQSVKIDVYMQYRTEGSSNSWTTIYLKSGTGTSYCDVDGSKATLSGYEYRIKAVCTATGASGSETATTYSVIVP